MYLQLAGKPKEGLKYLKNLRDNYIKKFQETQDSYYLEPNIYLQIGRLLDKEKNYKEELEEIDERSKSFKPKPWWAYGLFYCYLIFYGYIFWMEPLAIPAQ